MKSRNGIVAFLDILGYQNFIDNNSVERAVEILDRVFKGLKEAVIKDYQSSWTKRGGSKKRRFEDLVIQTLSDSIILHLSVESDDIPVADWLTLLQTTRVLQRRLFDNGFPSRGAVASGRYFSRDGFLVGRPFMDAYRLGQSLEFATTALTPEAFSRFKSDAKRSGLDWHTYAGGVEFLAPLKQNREERLYCLCPMRRREIGTLASHDVASLVSSSFWRHNKDVPMAVDGKINNTIKFWTYWICRKDTANVSVSL